MTHVSLPRRRAPLDKFLKSTEYGKQFEGLKTGSAEFNAKWKDVAKNDPTFGGAQHDFIKATHYNPAMSGLKAAGIDLSGHGAAVQDALWSTSVQFGPGSKKKGDGAIGMFSRALAGRDASKTTGPSSSRPCRTTRPRTTTSCLRVRALLSVQGR